MRGDAQLLSARTVRWIDAGVIVWVVVWVALGVLIWHDIRAQMQLSADVIKIGTAVKDTGQALGVVGGLPLVGGSIAEFAAKIEKMGAEVESSGEDSRGSIERTAVIAGLGVGILPVAMILFLYLPVRVRWRRYVGAVADALPWDRLRALSADPWRAIASGDYRALADAELARLGLRRP